ncbi:MAG: hemerythrin domain-containing protein [Candidatus Brocadiia bacterium]
MVAADVLVKEHRLIERVIPVLTKEVLRLHKGGEVNAEWIVSVVGFFRSYTDRCHHGKEEDILFRALATKPLSDEHRRTMDRLTEEHVLARKLVGRLMLDQGRCVKGEKAALKAMEQDLHELADLYPKHIALEEKHFFVPCMGYFSAMEQGEMLRAFTGFDAKIVHEQYTTVIEDLEAAQKAKARRGRGRK